LLNKQNNVDCACITAFKGKYSRKANRERNRYLLVALQQYGYGVTAIDGSYKETGLKSAGEFEDRFRDEHDAQATYFLMQVLRDMGKR
jgi:N-acetyl-anhydromuramyl-L-alanine amidase AmpD